MNVFFKTYIILIFLFLTNSIFGQQHKADHAFRAGEKIKYILSYQWGLFWVEAGEVVFEVEKDVRKNKEIFLLKCTGNSIKPYDWALEVREYFESVVHADDLTPFTFVRNSRELGFNKFNSIIFDHNSNSIFTKTSTSKNKSLIDTLEIKPYAQDIFSAAYALRNIDFTVKKPTDTLFVNTVLDSRYFNFEVVIMNKETVKDANGVEHTCIKLTAILKEGTFFKSCKSLSIWVTNDENKLPIKAEAEITFGKVKAYLKDYKDLKHPLQ